MVVPITSVLTMRILLGFASVRTNFASQRFRFTRFMSEAVRSARAVPAVQDSSGSWLMGAHNSSIVMLMFFCFVFFLCEGGV